MAVNSRYSSTYTKDIVTVKEVGAIGARCETAYGAEITVSWGVNLPSPVPQVGEVWYADRVSPSNWAFDSKVTGKNYSIMRYAISLDMASCIGSERSTIDGIADAGVNEVYLNVADGGVVYWDSESAESFGLKVCKVNGEPFDYVKQVVDRCEHNGLAITFVMDCGLWSDTSDPKHNYYQQVVLSEEFVGSMGWYAVLANVWDDIDNYTWGAVRDIGMRHAESSQHVPTWSFVTAAPAVKALVSELYDRYGERVRGVCFKDWCFGGAYADVSDYVIGEYAKRRSGGLLADIGNDRFTSPWYESRAEVMAFYADLQRGFISSIAERVGNWPVSVIVPDKVLSLSSERVGRFDTWVDDDFSSYGWSKVGCMLDYSKSVDRASELRSFEFLVANMIRFGAGATPLFGIDVSSGKDYDGVFGVLAKYNVSNVLLDDYDKWRLLSDQQVIDLKSAMNAASVTPMTVLDEFGVYLSSNTRDIYFYDEFEVNRYTEAAQDFCSLLLDKLPQRMRVLYDSDMESAGRMEGLSAIVLFEDMNMSDEAIAVVEDVMDAGSKNVVVIGRCGLYPALGIRRRSDVPFLDRFGEVDYGAKVYSSAINLMQGRIGAFVDVYAFDGDIPGVRQTRHVDPGAEDVDATSFETDGDLTVAPVLFDGRTSIASMEVLDEPVLLDMASEMVLYAIGRDA